MKKLIAVILSFVLLTGCAGGTVPGSSIDRNSEQIVETPQLPSEKAIDGQAPLLVKDLLYRLMNGGILYHNWTSPDQLFATYMMQFYEYNVVKDNYDELVQQYGTVIFSEEEYLAIPADIYEKYIRDCFGADLPVLNTVWEYDRENNVYRIDDYFSGLSSYDVTITDYTEDNGLMTVKYTSVYYNGKIHHRIMKAQQCENGWQYLSNGFDNTPPQTDPFPAVNMEKEKLTSYAMALAKQMVEYGRHGNYNLADVTQENASRLFMTNFIFTFESSKSYNPDYPYKNIVKRISENSSTITYPLNRVQMIAYQLYGFDDWFVPTAEYDYDTMYYGGETDVGWGFGPVVREISAETLAEDRIKVNIYAENVEAEEKYNFAVYFDVMTENRNTFLRFSEMTMETL